MDNKIPTINDENNNCTNCEYELNSDDEYSYSNDSEFISIDTRKLWHDIAHIIKCIYRETNAEFSENHSLTDLSQAKEYVEILTQSNPECLFNKIESIVLEYVDEIRNQVLKRSQTYLKTSNDVQLFISYLLDEYNTFIQAAKNVSTIVKYLEESYMKKFHLTWLLYNKHLYEKLVYMDKKIQQSMSIMIDLLQPSNEINNDYSPAEYTKLLNRFLAFDEEMSEIACLYKDSQMRNSTGIIVKKTRKEIKVEEPKKTKSTRRTNPPKSEIILPPKPPLKLQNPLTIPAGPSLLSAKIQSVSFTAGTFGSITTANHPRLNLNLSKTKSSTIACNNLDQLLRQAASPNEISSLLSSLQSSKPMEDLSKEKTCDFCCCDLFSESSNNCLTCMSLANSVNQRENETKKRLKLKINTRTEQTTSSTDQSKPNIGTKPSDNNIDDLVRFIDGNQSTPNELITKKTKKKKKSTTKNSTKRKETIEEEEKPDDQPVVMKPIAPPRVLSPPKEVPMESPMSPEEEVNWITISRKQSKHKTTTVPSLLAVPVNPPNNSKQKRPPPPPTTTVKTKTQAIAQPKMVSETVINSDKQPIVNTSPSARAQNTTKTQQKSEIPSAWTNNHEPVQVATTSTLLATAPAFVPSNKIPSEQSSSSLYWNPDGYHLPPGPVQRPNSSFSPAPGPRCIRRPSPESLATSFPTYSPMNYTSAWSETTTQNTDESQWKYSSGESSTIPDDFPLYDPFNSGTGLTISPSSLLTNGFQNNDINEMDALDKEIEDFKKSYIDSNPFDTHQTFPSNIDHRFIHQS